MERRNEVFEDDVPFQIVYFLGSMEKFSGEYCLVPLGGLEDCFFFLWYHVSSLVKD